MDFLRDPINFIANWLINLLNGWGLPAGVSQFLVMAVGAFLLAVGSMFFVLFLIWYERKIIGRIQDRPGPNRVGPWGVIQPFADMIKIFTKEYITPAGSDTIPFNIAPVLAVGSVMMIWAVLPFAKRIFGVDLNVGALYIIAVGALGTLAIVLAGWSSNNKFALLGAFRAVALLLSYEVPMVLALLVPVILARSMGLNTIVERQELWYIFLAPLPAFVFFITSMAEIGRSPFDLLEAESEIATGFIVEYSGLKFGMFYVAEFMHAFTISMIFSTLFLGGWRGPGAEQYPLLGVVYYIIKTFLVYFVVLLMKGSLPRLRIDQILDLAWKQLTPLALAILMVTVIVDKLLQEAPFLLRAGGLLAANILTALVAVWIFQQASRARRLEVQARLQPAAPENNA